VEDLSAALLTDGTWISHQGLDYYLRHHNLRLPDEFLAHIRALNYYPPAVTRDQAIELRDELTPVL
jgi:hypothetical protein